MSGTGSRREWAGGGVLAIRGRPLQPRRLLFPATPHSGSRRPAPVAPAPAQWVYTLPSQANLVAKATKHWAVLISEELEVQILSGFRVIAGVFG